MLLLHSFHHLISEMFKNLVLIETVKRQRSIFWLQIFQILTEFGNLIIQRSSDKLNLILFHVRKFSQTFILLDLLLCISELEHNLGKIFFPNFILILFLNIKLFTLR